MKYRPLGNTGLKVSEVALGCWALGGTSYGTVKDEDAIETVRTALEKGVNFFDTADSYGQGHSEEVLSKVFKGRDRDDFIVATKVGYDFYHGGVKKNFDAAYILSACEKSLRRLGLESIDVYQLHSATSENITQTKALDTLEKLKKEGKIRAIGVSAADEAAALTCLKDPRVQSLQLQFNLIDQQMCYQVFPKANAQNVGVIIREPLACGLLTDKYKADSVFPKNDHRNGWSKDRLRVELEKVEKVKNILATKRLSLAQAALEYALEFQGVSTVIPGAKSKKQLLDNLLAAEEPLLRSQESSLLRDLYQREAIFRETVI